MLPVQDSSQASETEQPLGGAVKVPEQTTEEVSANEEPQPEQKFTRAEVEAMLADFEKKIGSRIQSQVARSENRTDARIQERLAALDANRGVLKLSDADYEAAQDAIIREEQKNAYKPQSPKGNETQAPASDYEAQIMFVTDQINEVVRAREVEITPADTVEYKMITDAMNDPKGSLAKTLLIADKAAEMKAGRVKAFKENASARTVINGQPTTESKPKPKTAEEKISTGLKTTKWRSDSPATK